MEEEPVIFTTEELSEIVANKEYVSFDTTEGMVGLRGLGVVIRRGQEKLYAEILKYDGRNTGRGEGHRGFLRTTRIVRDEPISLRNSGGRFVTAPIRAVYRHKGSNTKSAWFSRT